jgi:Pectate lyase superfamily protein
MKKHLLSCLAIGLLSNLLVTESALAVGSHSDRINITDAPYNATPDSTNGSYDTAAINAAVAAVGAGGSVYFPPGRYDYQGSLSLPPGKSYRLYGDGPGVSTIAFTGPNAGILYVTSVGEKTFTVEGLSILANTRKCGTAIQAYFNDTNATKKFRTATIRNVQIYGSSRTGGGGYWTGGIRLYQAQNSVLANVEMAGENREPGTDCDESEQPGPSASDYGVIWDSATNYRTSGLQMSNIQITLFDTALRTNGLVENVFVTGFEFPLCGTNGNPAVDLNSSDSTNLGSTFHLVNGHVSGLQQVLRMTNLRGVKLSKLSIAHANGRSRGPDKDGTPHPETECGSSGNDVALNNVADAVISQCTFIGAGGAISDEIGIRLENSHYVQIAGNSFTAITPSNTANGQNACINVQSGDVIRVINNIFGDVSHPYYNVVPGNTYCRGNNVTCY